MRLYKCHIFVDLRALWIRGILDDELVVIVFGNSIKIWFPFSRRIDARHSATDDNVRFLNSNEWRINNVIPLERLCEQRHGKIKN